MYRPCSPEKRLDDLSEIVYDSPSPLRKKRVSAKPDLAKIVYDDDSRPPRKKRVSVKPKLDNMEEAKKLVEDILERVFL